MADDKLSTKDEATVSTGTEAAPYRLEYTVTAENGLFKNGKNYKKGDKLELDAATAERFADNGDVEADPVGGEK